MYKNLKTENFFYTVFSKISFITEEIMVFFYGIKSFQREKVKKIRN
ncbi:hypothetical protein ADIARSV_3549 [Arcticibacter svalbardensis MN12-7]|uniref:Uncharacterized protein n=1 Tax=Arcticibacter svalbardensis MN12-7 TaxID=1150600 RepID=R9GWG8_9SPHI|nr:hypothetical protein ADIARSV_3549 [Arcticibacter svalbardensis MN12-7]